MAKLEITDDLDALIAVLPPPIAAALQAANRSEDLLEIVLDLGRRPEARFVDQEIELSKQEVTQAEIDYVVSRIGAFGDDNRAGIERTLHRISAIRNRQGRIVGLTCRVGRAVYGTIDIIRDIVESGKSIMLLGRPGVGKTTMLREVARVLAEKKRVVVVDTSNEIGGDGDIPHPAIGRARRMQVKTPAMQHAVMIEAVENHMPEVIVIDEMGTELEAAAARTIAERGVQLVATAHGNTLENLMMNPTLCDLIGGIQTVTLSDEEARRRGTQKSVLERKAPPTFDVVIEIQDWDRLAVRHDVAEAVDAILRGRQIPPEIRYRDENGEIHIERASARPEAPQRAPLTAFEQPVETPSRTLRVFPYGISQNRLRQASKALNLPVVIVNNLGEADILMTSKSYYRKRPQAITDAERAGLSVYVLRSNTVTQMENCLADIFGLEPVTDPFSAAMQETQEAIDKILRGERSSVELSPQDAFVRRRQHEMARAANLMSYSKGKEPYRRVRIHQ
ncbi:MAG: AAA family ATPase [Chloroflexi bacterium]|nr:AAA family ATPase [Chloroflexota bacterium]